MRYVIKKTYRATEKNENFKGQAQVWYYCSNGVSDKEGYNHKEIDWYIKQNAYKTKEAVDKAMKAAQELKDWVERKGYLTIDSEIIEIEE